MHYFKKIEIAIKDVLRERQKYNEGSVEYETCTEKYNALQEILAYIHKGDWVTTTNGYNRIMDTLRYGVAETTRKYKCSANCIYVGLSKAGKRVEELIGAEVIDLIMQGEVEYGLYLYKRNTKQIPKIILTDILQLLPQVDVTLETVPYNLMDCKAELNFIAGFVKQRIQAKQQNLDTEKLRYIHYLLTTSDVDAEPQQHKLYKVLMLPKNKADEIK